MRNWQVAGALVGFGALVNLGDPCESLFKK